MERRSLVAGNWKMNGLAASVGFVEDVADLLREAPCDLLICPPATLIARIAGRGLPIGGQDCHAAEAGAHTGDISAEMLRDAGAEAVILGHSERRTDHGETDAQVCAKVEAAWRAGLAVILCVGETEAERDTGIAKEVVGRQLAASLPGGARSDRLTVAYEPVWAIGTGRTPSLGDIGEMHGFIRDQLDRQVGADEAARIRILYGGSVKPANAGEIFALEDVDGGLVGGASLKAGDFSAIARVAG